MARLDPDDPRNRINIHDFSLLFLRVVLGVVFIAHGSQKLFGVWGGPGIEGFAEFLAGLEGPGGLEVPEPLIAAWLTAFGEFFGGVLLVVGFLARIAAIVVGFVMVVAILMVHWGLFFLPQGMEFALTLLVVAFAILLSGPGKLSTTGYIRGQCCGRRRREEAEVGEQGLRPIPPVGGPPPAEPRGPGASRGFSGAAGSPGVPGSPRATDVPGPLELDEPREPPESQERPAGPTPSPRRPQRPPEE